MSVTKLVIAYPDTITEITTVTHNQLLVWIYLVFVWLYSNYQGASINLAMGFMNTSVSRA